MAKENSPQSREKSAKGKGLLYIEIKLTTLKKEKTGTCLR